MSYALTIFSAALFFVSLGLVGSVTNGAPISLMFPAALCQLGVLVCMTINRAIKRK